MTDPIHRGRATTALASILTLGFGGAALAEAHLPDLGPNTIIFEPSMSTDEIESIANAIHAQQVDDEMGSNRYALLFMPGDYGTAEDPLQISVGYYTEVAGLGASPNDVRDRCGRTAPPCGSARSRPRSAARCGWPPRSPGRSP